MNLSTNDCLQASTNVKNFVEKNGQLPNYVTISGKKYSMEQYMYISSNIIASYSIGSLKHNTPDFKKVTVDTPKIAPIKADIDKNTFYDMNRRVSVYFKENNKAPSYVSSKYGNVQFQAHIYANAKILDFYKKNKLMPNYVSLNLDKNSRILTYLPEYVIAKDVATIYSCIEINSFKSAKAETKLLLYVYADRYDITDNIGKVVVEIEGYDPVSFKKPANRWEENVFSILVKGKPEKIVRDKNYSIQFYDKKGKLFETGTGQILFECGC